MEKKKKIMRKLILLSSLLLLIVGVVRGDGEEKSQCQIKWESCMDETAVSPPPTAAECDAYVKSKFNCKLMNQPDDQQQDVDPETIDETPSSSQKKPPPPSTLDETDDSDIAPPPSSSSKNKKKNKLKAAEDAIRSQAPDDIRTRDRKVKEKERIFIKEDLVSVEDDGRIVEKVGVTTEATVTTINKVKGRMSSASSAAGDVTATDIVTMAPSVIMPPPPQPPQKAATMAMAKEKQLMAQTPGAVAVASARDKVAGASAGSGAGSDMGGFGNIFGKLFRK